MRPVTLALVGAITIATFSGIATAAPRSRDVDATPIYRRTVTLTSGTKTFATTDLKSSSLLSCGTPDTILVVTRPDGIEVMNDNCNSSTKRSCVTTGGVPGTWVITVFAQKPTEWENAPPSATEARAAAIPLPPETHCGTADVTINNSVLDNDAVFGGTVVEPGLTGTFAVHAPHTPNGATDTVLLGYSGSWQQVAYNNDSGVGQAAMATMSLESGSRIVVGSFSLSAAGRAALVLNDCTSSPDGSALACKNAGKDADGDSLSNALENEIGTDPNHHDTDRDGLFDYFEVIGRHGSLGEQELRRYGANPRRRDLFVELDREVNEEGDVANLYDENTVDPKFEDSFLDLPQLPPAPDGSRLIAVHFDVGVPCPSRPTLCGDWGHSSIVASSFEDTQAEGYPEFSGVRRV